MTGVVMLWTALLVPAAIAASAFLVPRSWSLRHAAWWLRCEEVGAAGTVLVSGIVLLTRVRGGAAVVSAAGLLRVDALSAYLLTVVGAVALTATWAGTSRSRAYSARGGRYAALVCLFLTAMVLAVVSDDLGVAWVAVEATTIATAFLVGHSGGRRAVEAAWKYVVLGSVGVGIAFLGLVLLYAATGSAGHPTLSWVELTSGTTQADPTVACMGLALAALGFATKAGLAPMHSWLPDAHSQAPAPVSGLMSGVLLAVAFGVILRLQAVDAVLLHGTTVRDLLLAGGLLSLLVAATLVISQRDYKRLLAYSSIEHMGLLGLGAAIGGPLALTAMLLHLLGHGLAKASGFVIAGRILATEGTSSVAQVRALLARRPRLAVPFLVAVLALLGLPPSGLFFTETAMVVAGLQRGFAWAMGIAIALLLVVTAGIGRHLVSMTLGRDESGTTAPQVPVALPPIPQPPIPQTAAAAAAVAPMTPIVLALGVTALLAVAVWPLSGVMARAVAVLMVAP